MDVSLVVMRVATVATTIDSSPSKRFAYFFNRNVKLYPVAWVNVQVFVTTVSSAAGI